MQFRYSQFNRARDIAYRALADTLSELSGKTNVTERDFARNWLNAMARSPELIAEGWYAPPPHGITILAATEQNPNRLSYSSLRRDEYWPSSRRIDWNTGFLLAYASPIDKQSGLIGDLAVTLYFGCDPRIKEYFVAAHRVTQELLCSIQPKDSASEIFSKSTDLFEANGFTSAVTSITDSTSMNIGHRLVRLEPKTLGDALSEEQREACRIGRRFLSARADWSLEEGIQFTIEPQLRSKSNLDLPQITFHYLVRANGSQIEVSYDVDELLAKYGLSADRLSSDLSPTP